jgi:hypothetical protein
MPIHPSAHGEDPLPVGFTSERAPEVSRKQLTWRQALRWLILGILIAAAMVLGAGNSVGW